MTAETTTTHRVEPEMILTARGFRFALRSYRADGSKARYITTSPATGTGNRRTFATREAAAVAAARAAATLTEADWTALTTDDRPSYCALAAPIPETRFDYCANVAEGGGRYGF